MKDSCTELGKGPSINDFRKFWLFDPSFPLYAFGTNLYYKIKATALLHPLFAFSITWTSFMDGPANNTLPSNFLNS